MTRLARILSPVFALALLGLGACASDTSAVSQGVLPAVPDLVQLPSSPQAQSNPCGDACATACVYGCAGCAGGLQRVSTRPTAPVEVPGPALPAGPVASLGY